MGEEFKEITMPVVNHLWREGYFTIPLPGGEKRKEFKLDIPAFKRFDILAMKWRGRELDVKAVESKMRGKEAIGQARIYQLYIPEVYIASNEEIDSTLIKKLNEYGIGYIKISSETPEILVESRKSAFFNRKAYETEVVPKSVLILSFYDFLVNCLGKERDEILKKIDYGVKENYLWISDRKSTEGIQWSATYNGASIRFGINLESVTAIENAFINKTEEEIRGVFEKIKRLPGNFYISFEDRCPGGGRFKKGMEHRPFKELDNEKEKMVGELSNKHINFMIQKSKYKYLEFGIWVEICKKEEIPSWTGEEFWRKMEYYKKKYLDEIYNDLK